MSRLTKVGDRAKTMLAGFTLGQRAIVLVAVLGLVLGAVALGRWATQPTWAPLFTNLSQQNASAIVDQLTADGVKYELSSGGTTINVPKDQVASLRVSLAGKGLTGSGSDSNSFSVLDNQGMTSTELQQNVAYQRAVVAELAKTLEAINGVNTAIVHIAVPKRDVFTTEADRTTASVMLDLAGGTTLSRAQIRSVMHLVAGSVPGLEASDVTVSDSDANLLSVREDGTAGAAGAASDTDQQTQAFEEAKSKAAQAMLDQVLGKGKAVVRVNAELNFDASDTTSVTYPTASTYPPLSEVTSSESYNGSGYGAGGAMGLTAPTLSPAIGGNGAATYAKAERTVDYGVNKIENHTVAAPGGVKRLTIAVLLDQKVASGVTTANIQSVVQNAVGFNQQRGDTVQVTQIPFDTSATDTAKKELAQAQSAARMSQYLDLGKKAGLVLLLLIAAFLWRRNRAKGIERTTVEAVASDLPDGPAMLSTLEEQLAIGAATRDGKEAQASDALDPSLERELLRDEVAKFVDSQPEEIAAIVQGWLGQRKN